MSNYEIIKDEKLLREFIEWLPDLKETEQYYLCLFARNKYCKELTHIKSDKAQLKRFVSTKQRMFEKIRQLEGPVGCYKQKETSIPQEALALYITPNPRDLWRATFNSVIKLTQCMRDQNILSNPHQEVMSEIQRTKGRTCFVDFDFDHPDESDLTTQELVGDIMQHINDDAVTFLQTRGGVHALIDPTKVIYPYKNSWHKDISKMAHVDQTGDMMIPVAGCTQGNFIPHFIKLSKHDNIPTEAITN